MTLSSEVELRWDERRAFRRGIIYAIVVGSNVLLVLAGPGTAALFDGFVKPISRVLLSNPRLGKARSKSARHLGVIGGLHCAWGAFHCGGQALESSIDSEAFGHRLARWNCLARMSFNCREAGSYPPSADLVSHFKASAGSRCAPPSPFR